MRIPTHRLTHWGRVPMTLGDYVVWGFRVLFGLERGR